MATDDDMHLMQASLSAAGGIDADFRDTLFARFFARYPSRRAAFINLEASAIRMTDESFEMMLGLAQGADWVWPLITELVFTHRSYGRLPWEEYEGWMALAVDFLAERAGTTWRPEAEAAWRRRAQQLLTLIDAARTGWEEALPPGYLEEMAR
jgi:hypothetical protein